MRKNRVGIFAYDISSQVIEKGQNFNEETIEQSITNIISTRKGERLFLPRYGSILPTLLFENINTSNGGYILDTIIDDILLWEDRIDINRERSTMIIRPDENTVEISILYIIKSTLEVLTYDRYLKFTD